MHSISLKKTVRKEEKEKLKEMQKWRVMSEEKAVHNKINFMESMAVLFEKNKLSEEDNQLTKRRLKLIEMQKK